MELSVESSRAAHHRPGAVKLVEDRILRALCHPLRLIHRTGQSFFVLGSTANVYTVTLSTLPSCTCPDHATPCKHILFILIRVLGLPVHDLRLRRRSLRPAQVDRLLARRTLPEAVAGEAIRRRFHDLRSTASPMLKEGATCPICLDEMETGPHVLTCRKCRNSVHRHCMLMWKSCDRRRPASCVICRARWNRLWNHESYLNLAAFVDEGDASRRETSSSL